MKTSKKPYKFWHSIRSEINGVTKVNGDDIKIIVIGLKNEDITQGTALRLNRIVKKIEEEFKTLQQSLDSVEGSEEEKLSKREELWNEEVEISFEAIDIEKLDIKRKDNSFGHKYDYTNLIDIICE
jgi:plasmid maintenance system antidote protein VapI